MQNSPRSSAHLSRVGFCLGALGVAVSCVSGVPARAVTIDWVTVGDPGNTADTAGDPNSAGTVAEEFRIGKYEVTIGQYADFLNAVAYSDPYSLYSTEMETDTGMAGIARTGSSGSYVYSVIGPSGMTPAGASSPGNRPISSVNWFDAARFANWMHNGQLAGAAGAASTETGAYTLSGATTGIAPARNANAQFYIPTENQWYKAAYYKGGGTNAGYWNYATQSDTVPSNTISGGINRANYRQNFTYTVTGNTQWVADQNYLTDAGTFASSASAYGTFDQSGNVTEWNDLDGNAGVFRGVRGGDFSDITGAFVLSSSHRQVLSADLANPFYFGFRLAAPVPEPSIYAMAIAGLACGGYSMLRRRKRA